MADTLIAPPPESAPVAPPTSTPAPPANISPSDSAEMDRLFAPIDAPEAPPAAPKVEPKPQAEPNPNAPRDDKGKFVAAPPSSPKPPEKPAAAPAAVPGSPKALRDELDRTRAEAKANAAAKTALEAKIQEYEAKGKDTEKLLARQKELEDRDAARESEIRALKFEASEEFKVKYQTPFNEAAQDAAETLVKIPTIDGTASSWERDFVPLYHLAQQSSPVAVMAKIREMFGDDAAPYISQEINKLVAMDRSSNRALQAEKGQWQKKQEQAEGQRVQQQEQAKQLYEKVNSDLRDSVPDYRDDPTDKELAAAREKGYQTFDYKPKTIQEQIKHGAHVRHRVAAFPVLKLQNARLSAEVERLKAELAGATETIPNPDGRRAGGVDAPAEKSWDDEYAQTVARA